MKRSPLKRGTKGLKRTPFKTRRDNPLRRVRLAPISAGRREVNAARAEALLAAWGPRPWTCEVKRRGLASDDAKWIPFEGVDGRGVTIQAPAIRIGPCRGKVNAHEVKSRARAGTDANLLDVANMLPLCNGHNTWCEDHPFAAYALGLTKHSWE